MSTSNDLTLPYRIRSRTYKTPLQALEMVQRLHDLPHAATYLDMTGQDGTYQERAQALDRRYNAVTEAIDTTQRIQAIALAMTIAQLRETAATEEGADMKEELLMVAAALETNDFTALLP